MGGNSLPSITLAERIERALGMFPDLKDRVHDLNLAFGRRKTNAGNFTCIDIRSQILTFG